MNSAAEYSARLLAEYDKRKEDELQRLIAAQQEARTVRSGRIVSDQPYGGMSDQFVRSAMAAQAYRGIPDASDEKGKGISDHCVASGSTSAMAEHEVGADRYISYVPQRSSLFCASIVGPAGEDGAAQIATLQAKLMQRLGPEYISTRQGPGGGPKLSYIEGWKAIDLANEVFGFNGWSSSITNMEVDYMDELAGGRWNIGVSAILRITLCDGTFHEDVGYGHCENAKSKGLALEKARKEASTDGLKRSLRTFGRMLGNCLYDKKFVENASKIKTPAPVYDLSALKRSTDTRKDPTTSSSTGEVSGVAVAGTTAAAAAPQAPPPAPALRRAVSTHVQEGSERVPLQELGNHATSAKDDDLSQQVTAARGARSKEDALREERRAIAAAKQAAYRKRIAEEEEAKREKRLQALSNEKSSSDRRAEKVANPTEGYDDDDDDDLGLGNVDEYDLALIDAGMIDEALQEEEPRPIAKSKLAVSKQPVSQSSMMDDSGICIINDRVAVGRITTGKGSNGNGKGRFVESSPVRPDRQEQGGESRKWQPRSSQESRQGQGHGQRRLSNAAANKNNNAGRSSDADMLPPLQHKRFAQSDIGGQHYSSNSHHTTNAAKRPRPSR